MAKWKAGQYVEWNCFGLGTYRGRGIVLSDDFVLDTEYGEQTDLLNLEQMHFLKNLEQMHFLKPLARKPAHVLRGGTREDGYEFFMVVSPDCRNVVITAGCQYFTSFERARSHWENRERLRGDTFASGYTTDHPLNTWSLQVVDRFEKQFDKLRAKLKAERSERAHASRPAAISKKSRKPTAKRRPASRRKAA
jgi:hypothetical protein